MPCLIKKKFEIVNDSFYLMKCLDAPFLRVYKSIHLFNSNQNEERRDFAVFRVEGSDARDRLVIYGCRCLVSDTENAEY